MPDAWVLMTGKFFVTAWHIYSVATGNFLCEQGDLYSKDSENVPNYSPKRNYTFSRRRDKAFISHHFHLYVKMLGV